MRENVSVAMAAYNGEQYIQAQIESILPQLQDGDELVISVDPGSDNTMDIVKTAQKKNSQIRVLTGPGKGAVKNFEHAIQHANNPIILLCDQDDIWLPHKIDRMAELLQENVCVVHDCSLIDHQGAVLEDSYFQVHGTKAGKWANMARNSFVGCCMGFRNDVLKTALPFPQDIPMHDQWIGLCAYPYGKVLFVSEVLGQYRRHESNATHLSHSTPIQMAKWRLHLIHEMCKRGIV